MVAVPNGERLGQLGRRLCPVEVPQPEAREGGLRKAERLHLLVADSGPRDRVQCAQRVCRPAVDHERGAESEARRSIRLGPVSSVHERLTRRDCFGDPTGHHEAVRTLDHQQVQAGIGRLHQPDGLLQQLRGGLRRRRLRLPGRPGQPVDGLGVAPARTARELVGHTGGRRPDGGQASGRLPVQREPQARWHVRIDGFTEQVVAELQQHAVLVEHPGGDDRLDRRHEIGDRPGQDRRQLGDRERRSQQGPAAQHLDRLVRERPEPTQDGQLQ
jgi:hypothetical protein